MNGAHALLLIASSTSAVAAAPPHVDLEVDPTAYVLSGYSVHVGIGWNHLRIDAGIYAMDLPEILHGNDGWDATFQGAGLKLQWFPLAAQRGLFLDGGIGASTRDVNLSNTNLHHEDAVLSVSASAGYRFLLPFGFYATPWAGLSYDLEDTSVMLDGQTFEASRVTPFAAVHLGYRFR